MAFAVWKFIPVVHWILSVYKEFMPHLHGSMSFFFWCFPSTWVPFFFLREQRCERESFLKLKFCLWFMLNAFGLCFNCLMTCRLHFKAWRDTFLLLSFVKHMVLLSAKSLISSCCYFWGRIPFSIWSLLILDDLFYWYLLNNQELGSNCG